MSRLASPIAFWNIPEFELAGCFKAKMSCLGCGLELSLKPALNISKLQKCGTHQISLIGHHDNFLDKPLNRNPSYFVNLSY